MAFIYDKTILFRETRVSQGSLVLAEQIQIRTPRIRPEPKSVKERKSAGKKEEGGRGRKMGQATQGGCNEMMAKGVA